MSALLQTGISLVLLVYILSVMVQAIQEFVKSVLGTKASVMAETVTKFMGVSLPLSEVKNALARRGLDLTALENLNKADFRHLLDGVEFAGVNVDGIVKTGQATLDSVKDNIAASYDGFRTAFQQAYTKKNKLFVLAFSFLLVIVLNANLLVLYDQISADQAVQSALVAKASTVPASAQSGTTGQAANDVMAAFENTRVAVSQDLEAYPIIFRTGKYGADYDQHPYSQIPGLLIMGILVSLGAPFWNDVLKGVTGINNSLSGGGNKGQP